MELTFQTKPLSWQRCVLRQVRRQEETAEAVVPDSWPDIGTILDAHASAMLRGKDLRSGSMTLSGGVRGTILYLPEDGGRPRCMNYYLPFTVKLEAPDLTERSGTLCDVRVVSADGRMINSRKALLRVELSCTVEAYEPQEVQLTCLEQKPDRLRVKQTVYEPELPLETAERSFTVTDSLEFPAGSPPMAELFRMECGLDITDRKLVGARAVFRGNASYRIVYQSEDGELCSQTFQLPFSQYCDLQNDYDRDEQAEFLPVITGCDLESDNDGSSQKAYLNLHVLVQCVVRGRRRLELLEDAFAAGGTLLPQWNEFPVEMVLDRPQTLQNLRIHLPDSLRHILHSAVYTGHPTVQRDADLARITVPVSVRVLGYDRDGNLAASAAAERAMWELPLAESADCEADCRISGEPYVSSAADGTEVRLDLTLQAACAGNQTMRTLCGGTLEPKSRTAGAPSVILRRAGRGTELWQIARDAGANEEILRLANGLEGELVPEDRVLLIPVG